MVPFRNKPRPAPRQNALLLGHALARLADPFFVGADFGLQPQPLIVDRLNGLVEFEQLDIEFHGARIGLAEHGPNAGRGVGRMLLPLRRFLILPRQSVVFGQHVGGSKFGQTLGVLLITSRFARLELDAAQSFFNLFDDVPNTEQILLDAFELSLGFLASGLVLGDPGGFLEDPSSLERVGLEQGIDLSLLDHRIRIRAEPRVEKQLSDVLQANRLFVQHVFALAASVQAPRHRDLVLIDRQASGRVVEHEIDLRHARTLTRSGTGEDDVGHLATAQALGRLGAEDPLDRVHDVAFPAAVGPDDAGDALVEVKLGAIREALETVQDE